MALASSTPGCWRRSSAAGRRCRGRDQPAAGGGSAAPPERAGFSLFAYFLELTLLEAYPGNSAERVVISEIDFGPEG